MNHSHGGQHGTGDDCGVSSSWQEQLWKIYGCIVPSFILGLVSTRAPCQCFTNLTLLCWDCQSNHKGDD